MFCCGCGCCTLESLNPKPGNLGIISLNVRCYHIEYRSKWWCWKKISSYWGCITFQTDDWQPLFKEQLLVGWPMALSLDFFCVCSEYWIYRISAQQDTAYWNILRNFLINLINSEIRWLEICNLMTFIFTYFKSSTLSTPKKNNGK